MRKHKNICRKIKGMYFGGLKVLKLEKRKLSEKVGVNRPASHFIILASLKEMLGAESYFIKKMEKVGAIVRSRISISSLFAREMLGAESYF